jgi:hypothetical protein
MALPLTTNPEDLKTFAKYLASKPSGATIKEAKAVLGQKLVDTRKVAALQFFGVVTRDGDRLKLTADVGRRLERATGRDFAQALSSVIRRIPA